MNRFLIILSLFIACTAIAAAQPPAPAVDPCAEITARAARAETKLKDWPALARYHDANSKTPAAAANA